MEKESNLMATKYDLTEWLVEALQANGGRGTIISLCKHVWQHHQADLQKSGDLFYTWQYDVRWSANELRRSKRMKPVDLSPKGIWELANK
jgi:hypothetical protein